MVLAQLQLLLSSRLNQDCKAMKLNLKIIALAALSVLAISPVVFSAGKASAQSVQPTAQSRGMSGSYLGGGLSLGVGNPDDNDAILGGNVQGRLNSPRLPVSLRGAALFNADNAALMPLVTYDIGIARNTNLYLGGGYSFTVNGDTSPLGDRDAPVLTAGIESAVRPHVVVYGDTKVGIDAYKDSSTAASFQVGAAYRF
jgi:hypothetical protein